jgi:hypothetical protein
VRLALAGITPIEVWDLVVGGRMLQEWRADATFAARVADMVMSLRDAPPIEWRESARALARSIEHVHVSGGGADAAIVAAIAARGMPCTRSADPFAAARAASLSSSPSPRLGVDIGQTGIKLALGDRVWRVERDFDRAPFRDDVPESDRDRARASTIEWIADVIRSAGTIECATVGLPCELDDDGRPRSCTYAWRDPEPTLISELCAVSGVSAIAIANDAELAALAARAELAELSPTTLVLTIGFGVGGALLSGSMWVSGSGSGSGSGQAPSFK